MVVMHGVVMGQGLLQYSGFAVTLHKKSEKFVSGYLVYGPPILPLMLILQLGMHRIFKFSIIVV